jgi:hypothetical protein
MPHITLDRALVFTHPTVRWGESCPILWDLRGSPATASQLVPYSGGRGCAIGLKHLESKYATSPRVTGLHIICPLLPYEFGIYVQNESGVTVCDVLEEIYRIVREPLTPNEWEGLSDKQQDKVLRAFDMRCRGAAVPEKEKRVGVRMVDCLLQVCSSSTRLPNLH